MAVHLQEPPFPSAEEGGSSRKALPMMASPGVPLQAGMKAEEPCRSTGNDLFSYVKDKEEDEEEATGLRPFSPTPTTSGRLTVKQSCPAEGHEMLSYLKKEEEEEVAEIVSLSIPRIFPLPAAPPASPAYVSPTAGRRAHPAGLETLRFFTPLTRVSASSSQPKRGCDQDAPIAGAEDAAPQPVSKKTTSAVWDYFTLDPREPCVAVCSACQKRVRRGKDGGTRPGTTALHKHLKVHHGLHLPGVAVVPPSRLTPPKERPHAPSAVIAESTPAVQLLRQDRNQPFYPPTHPTAVQLASDTAWMLAVDMQPFSYVESEGFRRLMAAAQPRWKVPGRAFFATQAVPELAKAVSRAVRHAVACSVGRTVHIAADLSASSPAATYMSVTGCWVAELGGALSRQHATLSVCAFEGPCSPEDVRYTLREVLQDWLYDLKVGGVVSDGGARAGKAVRALQLTHVPCLARCLRAVTKAFLAADAQVGRLLKTLRRVCGRCNRSPAARRRLLEAQANLGLRQPLWPETRARSGSTLGMLECLYWQRQAIGATLGQEEAASHPRLTSADWKLVKSLVEILKPFEDAAMLVARPDATLCQGLPLLWFLEEQLRALRTRYHQENHSTAAHLTTLALDALEGDGQLREMKTSMICRGAAFLDPRFRDITVMKLGGVAMSDAALLRAHIVDLAARSYVPPGLEADLSQAGPTSLPEPSSPGSAPGSAAWQFTLKRWRAITKSDPAMGLAREGGAAAGLREMEEYLHENVDHVGENADPMQYWQGKAGVWPALFRVAVFHFGCPPTSVFGEGLSSLTGSLSVGKSPKNLSPANVKMFAFIRKNRHLVPHDWRLSLGDLSSSQAALGPREDLDMEEEEDLLMVDEEEEENQK